MSYFEKVQTVSQDGNEALVGVFGEQLTGSKVDDISVAFKYPFYNTDYDMKTAVVTGDGAVSVASSLLSLSSTTGTAQAETKESVRYRPGHTGFADFTVSFSGAGTGYAGAFDDNDGFYLKYANGTVTACRRKGGQEYGVAVSASFVDWTNVNIVRIIFGYLGVANTIFQVRKNGWKTIAIIETEGELTATHVNNPSFPVRFKTDGAMAMNVGSINAGTLDGSNIYGARYFSFKGNVTLSGTDLATIAHFHNKTTYKTVNNKVKAQLLRYKFYVDAPASGSGTVEFNIIKNGTVTGTPSYSDVSADNSVMEYATNVTYNTGGRTIFTDWVAYAASTAPTGADNGGDSTAIAQSFGLYLLPNETATITAQNVSGNQNAVVRIVFNWIELF